MPIGCGSPPLTTTKMIERSESQCHRVIDPYFSRTTDIVVSIEYGADQLISYVKTYGVVGMETVQSCAIERHPLPRRLCQGYVGFEDVHIVDDKNVRAAGDGSKQDNSSNEIVQPFG